MESQQKDSFGNQSVRVGANPAMTAILIKEIVAQNEEDTRDLEKTDQERTWSSPKEQPCNTLISFYWFYVCVLIFIYLAVFSLCCSNAGSLVIT